MAHEELKALYEIDKQHSDTPWEFWQHRKLYQVWCDCLPSGPEWDDGSQYRRKPDAPVWPDDKEDARKWRELEEKVNRYGGISADTFNDIRHGKPKLIQGYTAEQWQTIIDGEFLCEFSDADWHIENIYADRIVQVLTGITDGGFTGNDYHWPYCRPLRTKGVRQPWFGKSTSPLHEDAQVLVTLRNGTHWMRHAGGITWPAVTEFIEL